MNAQKFDEFCVLKKGIEEVLSLNELPALKSTLISVEEMLLRPYFESWLIGFLTKTGSYDISNRNCKFIIIYKDRLILLALCRYFEISDAYVRMYKNGFRISISDP